MDDASYEGFVSEARVRAQQRGVSGLAEMLMAPIGCAGCTACCCVDRVELQLDDDAGLYQIETVEGKTVLQHKANGHCIYVDQKHGCTIYAKRPMECRTFNCIAAVRLGIPVDKTIVDAALERMRNEDPT